MRRPIIRAAAIAIAAALLLLALGALVQARPLGFDRALITALRPPAAPGEPLGGPGLLAFLRNITALGAGNILALATALAAGLLLAQRRPAAAIRLAAAAATGGALVSWAKLWNGRERPDLVPHLENVASLSFPSAHAANSAVVYLGIALLVAHRAAPAAGRYVVGAAAALVGLIGISRVYLGVHWPTDVLAGWAFGALWAWAWCGARTAGGDDAR